MTIAFKLQKNNSSKLKMISCIKPHMLYRMTLSIALLVTFTSCAITNGPGGRKEIGLDDAEMFGIVVKTFTLADGSKATLRKYRDNYSIKLQKYFQVIYVNGVFDVTYLSSNHIEGSTLLVLETNTGYCAKQIKIFSIKDRNVNAWDLGDCNLTPKITYSSKIITFDYQIQGLTGGITKRWTFRNDNLYFGEFDTRLLSTEGSINTSPLNDNVPRYIPPPPAAASGGSENALPDKRAKTNKIAQPKEPKKTLQNDNKKIARPSPPPPLIFKEQKQKASIILILDK